LESKSIEYESENYESTHSTLSENKICPFYYNLNRVRNKPDILIATYKDFIDPKERIQISNVIDKNDYTLVFDDCDNIDDIIANMYNMNIDVNAVVNASNELFMLKEMSEEKTNKMFVESDNQATENEFMNYNNLCKNVKYSGTIRNNKHFLNFLSRILNIIGRVASFKQEDYYSLNSVQVLFAREWIDFRTVNGIFARLIDYLNSIQYSKYEE
jgi:hypothetical protein